MIQRIDTLTKYGHKALKVGLHDVHLAMELSFSILKGRKLSELAVTAAATKMRNLLLFKLFGFRIELFDTGNRLVTTECKITGEINSMPFYNSYSHYSPVLYENESFLCRTLNCAMLKLLNESLHVSMHFSRNCNLLSMC